MAGRRPKPTASKRLSGTLRRDRQNQREPKPKAGARCPSWLAADAKSVWRDLAPVLERMKVLTEADREALALLCSALAEYRQARAVLDREGSTYRATTEAGAVLVRPRPELRIAQDAWRRARLMLVEFGLSPAARSKVSALDPAAEPDDAEAYFRLHAVK